jgi:hypothetical protein
MTTAQIPKQPKHGHVWERDKPTLGAFILFVLVALGGVGYAIYQGFQHGSDVSRISAAEGCNGRLFQDYLNRVAALQNLQDQNTAIQRRYDRDIAAATDAAQRARAYLALRSAAASVDANKASLGAIISAGTPPAGCKIVVTTVPPTLAPRLSPTAHATRSRSSSPSSVSNLPPLPSTVFVTVTRTITAPGAVVTLTIPGPQTTTTVTVNPGQRTIHVTRTATATVTVHPNQRTVTATRTVTVTRRPTRTTTHP